MVNIVGLWSRITSAAVPLGPTVMFPVIGLMEKTPSLPIGTSSPYTIAWPALALARTLSTEVPVKQIQSKPNYCLCSAFVVTHNHNNEVITKFLNGHSNFCKLYVIDVHVTLWRSLVHYSFNSTRRK